MSKFRIEIVDKRYDNEDAYQKAIHYITKPGAFTGACGVYPPDEDTAIAQFNASQEYSQVQSPDEHYLWHFYISSKYFKNAAELLQVASSIALIFSDRYQVYYGVHTDTDHIHIHFAVNAYSYHPYVPTLTIYTLIDYLHKVKSYLCQIYSTKSIEIQLGKEGPYV